MDSENITSLISSLFSISKNPMKPDLKRTPDDNEAEEFYQQFFAKKRSHIPKSLVDHLKSKTERINNELNQKRETTPTIEVLEPVIEYTELIIVPNGVELEEPIEECSSEQGETTNLILEEETTNLILEGETTNLIPEEDSEQKDEDENREQEETTDLPQEDSEQNDEDIIEKVKKIPENLVLKKEWIPEIKTEISSISKIKLEKPEPEMVSDVIDFTETLNDNEFKELFHVSKSTVDLICSKISPILETFYMDQIEKDLLNIVLISLNYLSHQQPVQEIAKRFNVSENEVESFLLNFCRSVSQMHDEFIRWPVEEEFEQNELSFKTIGNKGIDGVFGVIDSQGFKINPQKKNPNLFLNSNGIPNVYLQGVCNANHLFLDCFVGWPGSFCKKNVLENSPIYRKLERSRSSIPEKFHLIGNNFYQSKTYLLTPYSNDDLKPSQLRFNNLLQSKLVVFDETIAMLKDRFQRLFFLDLLVLDDVKNVILTACCIHNLCVEENDFFESESDDDHLEKRDVLAASIKF